MGQEVSLGTELCPWTSGDVDKVKLTVILFRVSNLGFIFIYIFALLC